MLARGGGQSGEHIDLTVGGVGQLRVEYVYAAVVLKRLNRVEVVRGFVLVSYGKLFCCLMILEIKMCVKSSAC